MQQVTVKTSSKPLGIVEVSPPQAQPKQKPAVGSLPNHVRIVLSIPEMLYDKFAEQAVAAGRVCAEDEIQQRLARWQDQTDASPLIFNSKERSELGKCLGHTPERADSVIAQIKNCVSLRVGEVVVELTPKMQQAVRRRVYRGQEYADVLRKAVIRGLEAFVGWRVE